MSLPDLIGGDCGRVNALVSLERHVTQDAAFKDEGLMGRSGAIGPRFVPRGPLDSQQMIHEYLHDHGGATQSFNMNALLNEMHQINSPMPAHMSGMQNRDLEVVWSNQIRNQMEQQAHHDSVWNELLQPRLQPRLQPSLQSLPPGFDKAWSNIYQDPVFKQQLPMSNVDESKNVQAAANNLLNSVDETEFENTQFMRFMNKLDSGEMAVKNNSVTVKSDGTVPGTWEEEFKEIFHDNISEAASGSQQSLGDTAGLRLPGMAEDWAQEYSVRHDKAEEESETYRSEFWNKLQDEWSKLSDSNQNSEHPWLSNLTEYTEPFKEYQFSEINDVQINDVQNPMELGRLCLARGDVPQAALCFEAAVKRNPDNAEAWLLLGTTQAENEQDPQAIAAFRRCVQLDPTCEACLMSLAVSYTNEGFPSHACDSLVSWMSNNNKYKDLIPPNFSNKPNSRIGSMLDSTQHSSTLDLFLRAVRRDPQNVDADVQCALGVLFNLSQEYDKAADCFTAALQARPDDSHLWNRLGATLANGNRSEEAVQAYHRALEIQPGFIRARYNVGVSCINLKAYREAAEHFLTALNQQSNSSQHSTLPESLVQGQSQMSDTVWQGLQSACTLLQRQELRPAIEQRDLKILNAAFGIDV